VSIGSSSRSLPAGQGLFLGVMTGTSLDGIDIAAVEIQGIWPAITPRFIQGASFSFGPEQAQLRALASGAPLTASQIAHLCHQYSTTLASACEAFIATLPSHDRIQAICVHGQTLMHEPPVSWQLLQPALIAARTKLPIISDLRQADLALGGQGAPLSPLTDWLCFRHPQQHRAVLNLGGFANLTMLAPGLSWSESPRPFTGFDVCMSNLLLDTIVRTTLGLPYDADGKLALSGSVDDHALDDLEGILLAQSTSGKSLGSATVASDWLHRHWRHGAGLSGATLAATACRGIAQCIATTLLQHDKEGTLGLLIAAGGGCRNQCLLNELRDALSVKIKLSLELEASQALPMDQREAAAWAILGALCAQGVPLPLKHLTGASSDARAGIWTLP
jgi:anhydro-N-acetylmuramic acid kinase